jgi:hypothetical protein
VLYFIPESGKGLLRRDNILSKRGKPGKYMIEINRTNR